MSAYQNKTFRESFTKELAGIKCLYNQEAKVAIVNRAVGVFSVLPVGNRYRYELVGGKDECAKMLTHIDTINGELVREPSGGLDAEIQFQRAQLVSLIGLKKRLQSELSMYEAGDKMLHDFPLLLLPFFGRSHPFYEGEKRASVNQVKAIVELSYRARFNIQQMEKQLNSSLEHVKSVISILKTVNIGCSGRSLACADKIIAAACGLTVDDAHKRRLRILNDERDKKKF